MVTRLLFLPDYMPLYIFGLFEPFLNAILQHNCALDVTWTAV